MRMMIRNKIRNNIDVIRFCDAWTDQQANWSRVGHHWQVWRERRR